MTSTQCYIKVLVTSFVTCKFIKFKKFLRTIKFLKVQNYVIEVHVRLDLIKFLFLGKEIIDFSFIRFIFRGSHWVK